MSRPSIINDDIINKIEEALLAGNYILTACEWAGISKDAYYDWLHKGEDPEADDIYKRFADTVKKARAEAEVRNVANIQRAANSGTWQASAWWLERSFHERWGRKTELSGPNQGPIQVEVSREELTQRILELLGDEDEPEDDS